ncbi:phosphoglycerate kinase [Gigaspora margarita]|uniref:phosphoglycerate kinase n=1 Tax=Gigaspora margarita TaxID=4874 RepID=A0A8H3ZZD2_GIGMA|nr:phosphoglycerate kinase [Gigaspora margarita]
MYNDKITNNISIEGIDLKEKRGLIRVDFNVPSQDDKIQTINASRKSCYFDVSFRSSKWKPNPVYSLKPVANELQKQLSRDVLLFLNNCIGPEVKKACLTSRQSVFA